MQTTYCNITLTSNNFVGQITKKPQRHLSNTHFCIQLFCYALTVRWIAYKCGIYRVAQKANHPSNIDQISKLFHRRTQQ